MDETEAATLAYARPGTFRQTRTVPWRPWAGAVVWLLVVASAAVFFAHPQFVIRLAMMPTRTGGLPTLLLKVGAVLVAILATPPACPLALVGGFFLFPRRWRMTALGLLLILLSILLPIVLWIRG